MKNKNESGRTIVEMIGVVAIIGLLTVGGISWYGSAISKVHLNDLLTEVRKRTIGIASVKIDEKGHKGVANRFTEGLFNKQRSGRAGLNGLTAYGYGVGDNNSGVEKKTIEGYPVVVVPVGKINKGKALTPGMCESLMGRVVQVKSEAQIGDVFGVYEWNGEVCNTKASINSCDLMVMDTEEGEETVNTVPDIICIAIRA